MTASQEPYEPHDERRSERRMRTLKRARIVFNGGYGVFDCLVRNISPGGALLDVPSMLGIPSRFEISIDSGPRRSCTMRWHTDHLAGIQFDSAVAEAA